MKKTLFAILIPLTLLSSGTLAQSAKKRVPIKTKPKLALVLVIDQFRADTIQRYENLFLPARDAKGSPGGFRFLMEEGAYFPLAEYGQLQNMTCPGHATILSGAYSYRHGIGINNWYDRESGKLVYCVEDAQSPLVGKSEGRGVSPRNFIGTTLSDELKNSGYQNKSISIALKDRSAVLLGGYRNDLALWFDSGRWVSSQFYLPDGKLPAWVNELNSKVLDDSKTPFVWDVAPSQFSGRSLASNEDLEPNKWVQGMGEGFPHRIAKTDVGALMTPYATRLTLDAAIAALNSQKLGSSPDTDVLAVSFSAHDFLVHTFGPNSREAEAMTVDEDKSLAKLFAEVEKSVGLKNTVIVLTADHGGASNPNWLKKQKLDAGRLSEEQFVEQAENFLSKKYGRPSSGSFILGAQDYNLYLNYKALRAVKETPEKVSTELATFFRNEGSHPSIAHVFSGQEIVTNTRRTGPFLEKLILQTYQPQRSGDVILIPKPNYLQPKNTADHISGYAYDRYVPLFFYGPNIKAGKYAESSQVVDIAPTLAYLLGTTPPSGSEGKVLDKIFKE